MARSSIFIEKRRWRSNHAVGIASQPAAFFPPPLNRQKIESIFMQATEIMDATIGEILIG
jgi:hypothetical protein